MKKICLFISIIAAVNFSCSNPKTTDAAEQKNAATPDTVALPEKSMLSREQLQEQIDKEIEEALRLANDALVKEAEDVLTKTREVNVLLLNGMYDDAIKKIAEAIGKAEVVTAMKPELQLVPTNVEVATYDFVADINTVKRINDEVESLTDKGHLQAARHLLNNLASEVNIKTYYLPLATYPDALKEAAKLINEKKYDEAIIVLNTALNTIVIEEQAVALPLIRAERMLLEVDSLLAKKDTTQAIGNMLENAEYQIKFAEALGYGKKDKEFSELYNAIKQIREELEKAEQGAAKNLVSKLREKLKNFKERISPKETKTHKES